jgi:DNA-binding response OmpR family regulator
MKVLLLEDEPDLGASIKEKLSKERYIVDWFLNGDEAWIHLQNYGTEYTLAIFDWLVPNISGLELCQRLRHQHNPLPVLMLTAKDSMEDKVTGLDAGADDYLVKPFGMEELLARVRALQRRTPQLQSKQLQVGNLILDYSSFTVICKYPHGETKTISLTKKEFHLLEYFMTHPNQIVNRDQILNYIYTFDTERVSNVIAAQIRLLRRKLSQIDAEGFIETVPSMGYRFNPRNTQNS